MQLTVIGVATTGIRGMRLRPTTDDRCRLVCDWGAVSCRAGGVIGRMSTTARQTSVPVNVSAATVSCRSCLTFDISRPCATGSRPTHPSTSGSAWPFQPCVFCVRSRRDSRYLHLSIVHCEHHSTENRLVMRGRKGKARGWKDAAELSPRLSDPPVNFGAPHGRTRLENGSQSPERYRRSIRGRAMFAIQCGKAEISHSAGEPLALQIMQQRGG